MSRKFYRTVVNAQILESDAGVGVATQLSRCEDMCDPV